MASATIVGRHDDGGHYVGHQQLRGSAPQVLTDLLVQRRLRWRKMRRGGQ